LEKAGFLVAREGAKHIVMAKGGAFVTIPRHDPVNAYTMGGIIRDAGFSVEEFRKLL
jgi:HicA toxin of bacterial toxin-antitoxin,